MIIWEYNVRCSSFFVAIVGPSLSKRACLWSPPGTPLECFAFEAFFENPPVDTTTTSPTSFPRPFSNFPPPGQDLCIGVNLHWEGKFQVSSGSWRARWGKKYVDPYHIHWRIIWWMMVNVTQCELLSHAPFTWESWQASSIFAMVFSHHPGAFKAIIQLTASTSTPLFGLCHGFLFSFLYWKLFKPLRKAPNCFRFSNPAMGYQLCFVNGIYTIYTLW